jgi:ABC-type glycerol-3-phosphate transport system substrate-binding protein
MRRRKGSIEMKKAILLFVMTLLTFSLVSCASAKPDEGGIVTELQGPVEISWWHTLGESHEAALQGIVDRFNAENENINVTLVKQTYSEFDAKIMAAARSGDLPDIISEYPDKTTQYVQQDLLVDLRPYIENSEVGLPTYQEDINPVFYEECNQWGEMIYCMPLIKTGELFFYNKALFDELGLTAPETWTELKENSAQITEVTGKPAFGFDSYVDGFLDMLMQSGGNNIDYAAKQAQFNSEEGVAALTWFKEMIDAGTARLVGEDVYFSNPFGSQAVASYIGSSAGYPYVEMAVDGSFEVGVSPIPQEGPAKFANIWGSNMIIFKSTPERQLAAWTFFKYLLSPEVNAEYAVALGALPVTQKAIDTATYQSFMAENIYAKALSEQSSVFGYFRAVTGAAESRVALEKALEEALLGTKPIDQALQDAAAEANAALAQ